MGRTETFSELSTDVNEHMIKINVGAWWDSVAMTMFMIHCDKMQTVEIIKLKNSFK